MSFARSLKDVCEKIWEDCYHHPFVQELGAGTLDRESFKFYLIQDYKYLIEYAKIFAAGALKSKDEATMTRFTVMQHAILYTEMDLHRSYMKRFGIAPEEAQTTKTSLLNKAYTSNMASVGQTGGVAEIVSVVLPCAWSYYDFAVRLRKDFAGSFEKNFYRSWIESYSSNEYRDSIEWLFETLDAHAESTHASELAHLAEIFETSIEFEYLFWDMAYKKQLSY